MHVCNVTCVQDGHDRVNRLIEHTVHLCRRHVERGGDLFDYLVVLHVAQKSFFFFVGFRSQWQRAVACRDSLMNN